MTKLEANIERAIAKVNAAQNKHGKFYLGPKFEAAHAKVRFSTTWSRWKYRSEAHPDRSPMCTALASRTTGRQDRSLTSRPTSTTTIRPAAD
jgi:hypothetical protein